MQIRILCCRWQQDRKREVAELDTARSRLPDNVGPVGGGLKRMQGAVHAFKAWSSAFAERVLLHGREDPLRDALATLEPSRSFQPASFLQFRAKVMMAADVNPASFESR